MNDLEKVVLWETRRICQDSCPDCGTKLDSESASYYGHLEVKEDALPVSIFYEVACPKPDCSFYEILVTLRDKYVQGNDPLQEAVQVLGWAIHCILGLTCGDCGVKLSRLFLEEASLETRQFTIRAFCPKCEIKNEFHFGWKVINLPEWLDPDAVVKARVDKFKYAGELFSAIGIKGSVP